MSKLRRKKAVRRAGRMDRVLKGLHSVVDHLHKAIRAKNARKMVSTWIFDALTRSDT